MCWRVFRSWVRVCKRGISGGMHGVCSRDWYLGDWYLGVWSWWRLDLIWCMVWGVNLMLMREGIVWIGCGWLEDWAVYGV